MTENEIRKIVELAETIADNKFIMGDKLVEIGVSGPNLEASLSSISMAQGELGHARLIYRWAHEVQGQRGGKDVKSQTGKAFEQIVQASNWVELIAGFYVNNVAIDLVMKELMKGNGNELKAPFSKMLNEQYDHLVYSKDWSHQLLQDTGSIPGRFKQEVDKAMKEAVAWLSTIEKDSDLISSGAISPQSNLSSECKEIVEELPLDRNVSYAG
ncbi:Phenylacetic acid catabolic protein [Thalassobacillus sp. C254]|uniref:Phenylacetic acid catabolic protein n=1 Tax=Thalassobacillus sp. C254 TaxID=1225341 RepID=UPI0006CF99CE|nr:Phenylacetic acid catabolic protein [Thalassobacillus sp. C254]